MTPRIGRVAAAVFALLTPLLVATAAPASATGVVQGMDVSGWQRNVDWSTAWANGARFAYVKATEGTGYRNPYFTQQYDGSYQVGMIRGAYHFARPDISWGTEQANYFVAHGGGWSRDGKTLPGTLDIEWNPHGGMCYGRGKVRIAHWISSFSVQYHRWTGRYPVIYSAYSWWATCVGTAGNFSRTSPFFLAHYSAYPGTMPYAWQFQTFWQYADHGIFPGDQDRFNGSYTQLRAIANG